MNPLQSLPFNPETAKVGEIVSENYHAAGVFKKHKLDFCCGGDKTLIQACQKSKADIREVIQDLLNIPWGETSSGENFKAWEPDFLIDYIESTHHRFVRLKTDEIAGYAARVAHVHGGSHPENIEVYEHFIKLAQEMIRHLEAEENTVFPLIKKVYRLRKAGEPVNEELVNELKKELELMEDDHEEAGSVMAAIAKLTGGYMPPPGACTTYRVLYQNLAGFEEDLHRHVHLENNILFKKAESLV